MGLSFLFLKKEAAKIDNKISNTCVFLLKKDSKEARL